MSKMKPLVILLVIVALGWYVFAQFQVSTTEKIALQNKEILSNLRDAAGGGHILVSEAKQTGIEEINVDLVKMPEPGFVVVSYQDTSIEVEPSTWIKKEFYWGVSDFLEKGEYNGPVVKNNLEQITVSRNSLWRSEWKDDGDRIFNDQLDTKIKENHYMLSKTKTADAVGVPYTKLDYDGFVLIEGKYEEEQVSESAIEAIKVVGQSDLLQAGLHERINIPLLLHPDDFGSTFSGDTQIWVPKQLKVTIWLDDGDGVFNKQNDTQFKLNQYSKLQSRLAYQEIVIVPE